MAVGLESGATVSIVFMVLWAAAEVGRGALALALSNGAAPAVALCTAVISHLQGCQRMPTH